MLPPITKPTFLVDEQIARRNIQRMAEKASRNHAVLRPHFKTHQSAVVGGWFRDAGITSATVSSADMAAYFAEAGWQDLLIAFPYNPLEAKKIGELARKITLGITITTKASLDQLNNQVKAPVNYYIKVDVGTHRTGVRPDDHQAIREMAESKNPDHSLKGLVAHAGHTYKPLNQAEAKAIFQTSISDLNRVKNIIGKPDLMISYGDTPSCTLLEKFPGVDELRPGNFVFYDTMQLSFGVCQLEDIAVCMACPVVSIHPDRGEAVVYGGGVHFSKDFVMEPAGRSFGRVVSLEEEGWGYTVIANVDRLSQEHGILKGSEDFISSLKIGELVGILPVHSCLTADLQGHYLDLRGSRIEKLKRI